MEVPVSLRGVFLWGVTTATNHSVKVHATACTPLLALTAVAVGRDELSDCHFGFFMTSRHTPCAGCTRGLRSVSAPEVLHGF